MSTTKSTTQSPDGKEEDPRIQSLKGEGLLHCKCYAMSAEGVNPFLPEVWEGGVPCVYNTLMPTLPGCKPGSNLKQMGQAKLFEYMCMTYFLNNFVENQKYITDCPDKLKEKYKSASSIAPFFNLKYQTWKFISDQTAALDIDFSSFWDCDAEADKEIKPSKLTIKEPFTSVGGIDIKIQDTEGYTMGADMIRAIDKFLKLIRLAKSFRQFVAIKGKLPDQTDYVKKVYMFTVNIELLHKIFPSLFNNEQDDNIDLTKFNAIKKHLFNFKLSRLIFKRIADNGVFELETDDRTPADKREIILDLMEKDTNPGMTILKKYFNYEPPVKTLVMKEKKENEEVEVTLLREALDTVIDTCAIKTQERAKKFKDIMDLTSIKDIKDEIYKLSETADTERKIKRILADKPDKKQKTDEWKMKELQKILRGIIILEIYNVKIEQTKEAVRDFLGAKPSDDKGGEEEEEDEKKTFF